MITNLKESQEILKNKGLKPTYQRLRILEYLEKHKIHPTVDMIYQELLKEIPTISKTTIYNTLNSLAQKGIISGITITGVETRYEYKELPHHHFLCKSCGKVFDIPVRCPYFEKKEIPGFKVEELQGYFKGICKECLRKKK
jgi:Fur family peroxide stress response transcriptional regulator